MNKKSIYNVASGSITRKRDNIEEYFTNLECAAFASTIDYIIEMKTKLKSKVLSDNERIYLENECKNCEKFIRSDFFENIFGDEKDKYLRKLNAKINEHVDMLNEYSVITGQKIHCTYFLDKYLKELGMYDY